MKLRIRIKEVRYRMRGVPQERWKASFLINGRPVGNLTGYKADIEDLVQRILNSHDSSTDTFDCFWPEMKSGRQDKS